MDRSKTPTGGKTMRGLFTNRWVFLLLRMILGGIFIYAGALKIDSPQTFADNIAGFQLLPNACINLLALSLPVFEIIVGLMLIVGFRLRIAAFSVMVLSVIFAVALGSALVRGLQIDCGCFGEEEPSILKTWLSLGRDILMGIAALIIWRRCSCSSCPKTIEGEIASS